MYRLKTEQHAAHPQVPEGEALPQAQTEARAALHYTTLYYTTLHYTILYYTILHYTILYYATLHYTILFYTNSLAAGIGGWEYRAEHGRAVHFLFIYTNIIINNN